MPAQTGIFISVVLQVWSSRSKLVGRRRTEVARSVKVDVVKKALAHTRTMGVALGACILPAVGKPGFSIGEAKWNLRWAFTANLV